MINDRLQRSAGLRLAEVFKKLSAPLASDSPLWRLYLRTYELLWSMQRGELCGAPLSDEAEGDAWLAMRIVRHYARNWLDGAARFAMLILPYLAQQAGEERAARAWHDTRTAAANGEPSGLAEAEDDEERPIVHPARDPELTGIDAPAHEEEKTKPMVPGPMVPSRARRGTGQSRQPFEYGEILRAAGVTLSDHDLAVLYYREKAAPYLVRFPARKRPRSLDPLPEGVEPWEIGDAFDDIDWMQSILQSPHIVPGMTTVRRVWGQSEGADPASVPLDLDVYIDSSGSMPNPQHLLSFPTLAGAILSLSALRAGAKVQITVWSGKAQVSSTHGFIRDRQEIMRTLISYYGGGTQFPLPVLRETYLGTRIREPAAHILVISDDGVTTVFDKDERGNDGWSVLRAAIASAGGGATFVLNLPRAWESPQFQFSHRDLLLRARAELGIAIYRIDGWEELVSFARDFARRAYEPLSQTLSAHE